MSNPTKTSQIMSLTRAADQDLAAADDFAADVLEGLSARAKRLSSKYFYDDRGSELFQGIMDLDEYYLTRAEYEILETHSQAIADAVGREQGARHEDLVNLVELGPGDGLKSLLLISEFERKRLPFQYVPIDISEGAIVGLVERMQAQHPDTTVHAMVSDYFQGLHHIARSDHNTNLVLFLGSNIGNFDDNGCHGFLCRLWNSLNDGDLVLIGFDLRKDIATLLAAYNDEAGVTRDFNLNLLERINRELGGNFDLERFEHYAVYNPHSHAMESYLISRGEQTVHIDALNRSFSFEQAEAIHTEYSHKYSMNDVHELAGENGFEVVQDFFDSKQYFVDTLWRVRK